MIRCLAIAFVMLLAGGASAQSVHFPSVAVGPSAAGPEITAWLYKPSGTGPFPAIVLEHSCAGVNPHTEVWGKLLASWGYVVLAPDSFGPRGEKQVCTTAGVVTGGMRVADVAGAMKFLATQPDVRADRHRHHRPQPWRLDGDAVGAEELRPCGAAGSRPPSPTIRPARRGSTARSTCRC